MELHNERGVNGMSDSRITARDVQSWSWFTGVTPELWERKAIRSLDNTWMRRKHG